MHIHNWLYISKSDRCAFLLLLITLVIIIGIRLSFYKIDQEESPIVSEEEKASIEQFAKAVQKDSIARSKRYTNWKDVNKKQTFELFPFDPNTADSTTLLRIGLAPWQIRNMMKYREKNGKWRSADDFSKLYGLSHEDFIRLRPFIRIKEAYLIEHETTAYNRKADTIRRSYPEIQKFTEGITIDINAADTTLLKKIPGIGSYYAQKICSYRERLGGFVHIGQINNIEGLPDSISRWFTIQEHYPIKRLNINTATFKDLARHPYLTYEQVKIIDKYRKLYGKLKNWEELRITKEFEHIEKEKLNIYFYFE